MRIAVLIKQVPVAEALSLRADGRLERDGLELEMNAFCRRAVAQGVALIQEGGGSCTVFSLGPLAAADVLREAVAWGADLGVHITGPEFAGSDTLATARALTTAVRKTWPYDLVLVGRNAVDADTGQVGPAVAQFLDLPFLGAARSLTVADGIVRARLEQDDGWELAEATLPAVIACAERLCPPCKVPEVGRATVSAAQIVRLGASDLGPGPWGQTGSATAVGAVRLLEVVRSRIKLQGPASLQVSAAVKLLADMGAIGARSDLEAGTDAAVDGLLPQIDSPATVRARRESPVKAPVVAVVVEPGRAQLAREMLGAAAGLATAIGGSVTAIASEALAHDQAGSWGADEVLQLSGGAGREDIAGAIGEWSGIASPWAILAPSTMWGREVAARVAVILQAGLTGDAVDLGIEGARLVAWKPAFGGRLVASVTATSSVQMITVRPGALPLRPLRNHTAAVTQVMVNPRSRVRVLGKATDDDVDLLATASVVIGVGTGVAADEYPALRPLQNILDARLAGTRRVTDRGWLPRSRQIGLTGLSIRPRLYVAVGLSGKFNHMIGVRGAGCVLAVNRDPEAPVFESADIGIVADWQQVVPELVSQLTEFALLEAPAADESASRNAVAETADRKR
ncbi:MAG TPA: FAD-binding protein [Candidatus Nanopelagicaceae bacterium]|nr:FAD-binding protein [Candidatus Nanopelagicaceae bacterium]